MTTLVEALWYASSMRISVIIPTLNEAACLAETLAHARALGKVEIVIADGGSSDGTLNIARSADLLLDAPRGRASQLNAGARASHGEVLLFLHADCWLEAGSLEALRRALDDPGCVAGCFQQAIGAAGWKYRALERGNAIRARLLGWIYGDQGLFVRRETFERLGGFPLLPLMEDLYFAKQLKRAGRVALVDSLLHVSARRWQRQGVLRRTVRNWSLIALAHAGVSMERLARTYQVVR